MKENIKKNSESKINCDKNKDNKKRSFKAIYIDPNGDVIMEGRHFGTKPKQAAYKALTGIYDIFEEEGKEINGDIKFGLYETTRGSNNKEFWYSGKKIMTDTTKLYVLPNNEKYFTEQHIKDMGGFELIFGKKEIDVKPSLEYKIKKNKKNTESEIIKLYILPDTEEVENIISNFKKPKNIKKYFTPQNIKEMGGFEKIFGKKESDVKPTIEYKSKNNVKKAKGKDCEHLKEPKKYERKGDNVVNNIVSSNLNKKGYKKSKAKKSHFEIENPKQD